MSDKDLKYLKLHILRLFDSVVGAFREKNLVSFEKKSIEISATLRTLYLVGVLRWSDFVTLRTQISSVVNASDLDKVRVDFVRFLSGYLREVKKELFVRK